MTIVGFSVLGTTGPPRGVGVPMTTARFTINRTVGAYDFLFFGRFFSFFVFGFDRLFFHSFILYRFNADFFGDNQAWGASRVIVAGQ